MRRAHDAVSGNEHRDIRGNTALLIGTVAAVVVVLAVTTACGHSRYADQGLPFPGWGSAVGYAMLRLVAAIAGGLTLGSLMYALFCAPTTAAGRIDICGYRGVRVAEWSSMVWVLACAIMIPMSAADAAGISAQRMIDIGGTGALIAASTAPKAWIVAALCTLAVAVATRFALSWNSVLGVTTLAVAAVLCPPVVGNAGEGPNHDYATGAVIPFTVALSALVGLTWCVLSGHSAASTGERATVLRRYRVTLAVSVVVMAATAAILVPILTPPPVFGGWYGALGVGAACLLAFHGLLCWWLGRVPPDSGRVPAVLHLVVVAETVWLGISVAMAIQPAPAFRHRSFTAQQVFLGFDVPSPPSVWQFVSLWRFDVVLGTSALVLGLAYIAGAIRLHRRGDRWPRWRMVSWLAGCAGLLLVTSSGIGAYSYAMFSVHMAVHMALNMFLPELLVLGAPVTLVLRAVEPAGRTAPPGPREWLLWLMHSRFTKILSHPAVALAVFVVSLYGLYFTPLFDELIRFHWGHLLMNIHFLLTGYLFYWAIIGIDPGPRRLPHLGRLGMLFAVMPFHAFFGVAVMSMESLIGTTFYPELLLSWMTDPVHDQWVGGTVAWISGEIPVLLVVGALLSQWSKQDRREAKRSDRHQDRFPDDDELAAYNAMLAELGRTRR